MLLIAIENIPCFCDNLAMKIAWHKLRIITYRIFIALSLIFLLAIPKGLATASALDPRKKIDQYILDIWQDNLPHAVIKAVTQTPDGYLWIGTYEGLVRFDGVNFTVFDKKNVKEITNN